MNFNLSATTGAVEAGSTLTAGIHNATFKGINKGILNGKDGNTYNVMELNLEIENYGEFKHNFFEPTSNERKPNAWGGTNPSQVDNFLIAIRQVLDALDPTIGEGIDDGSITIGGSFMNIIKTIKDLTDKYIDQTVQIKLLPQNNGYNAIPTFCARITKNGALGIGTKFIGKDLTLTANELKKIETAKNAAPTNMDSKAISAKIVSDMNSLLDGDDDDDDDDLPIE